VQAIFLETGSQTWAGSRSDSRLDAIETLSQQFICVCPAEFSWLVLQVFASASVVLLDDDFSNQWVLHHDAGKFADVGGSGFVIFVGEAVRVGIVCRLQA